MFDPEIYKKKCVSKQITIRFPDGLFQQIEQEADAREMTKNEFILACCQYALENMERPPHKSK